MEIVLESIEDVRSFIKRSNSRLGKLNSNSKVTISAKLLSTVLNEYEDLISDLERNLKVLDCKLDAEHKNLVEEWIEENIDCEINEGSDESEEEIRKNCIETVEKELTILKAEKNLAYVNMAGRNYNFLYRVYDIYFLEPDEIIKKVEKDLAELEVPANTVEEEPVESN